MAAGGGERWCGAARSVDAERGKGGQVAGRFAEGLLERGTGKEQV